ncbi:MAG TPA: hypothetical protein VFV87_18590 [Pirellulaceae bacterium]|nr:hypothetical protein [Pirellulaceae bacterium]
MSSDPQGMSSDTKKLIPILIIIGVLMCGCIAVPVVGGIAMLGFVSARHDAAAHEALQQADAVDFTMPGEIAPPMIPQLPQPIGEFSPSGGGKEAAQARMLAAEADLQLAQAQYNAAQAVYEQQRNFANAQAGRLGAQGVSIPPPQPPDPSLYQAVLAAQQNYDAAKAEYEAFP